MSNSKITDKEKEEIANLRLFLAGLASIWIGSILGLANALSHVQEKPVLISIVLLLLIALIFSNAFIIKCYIQLTSKTDAI